MGNGPSNGQSTTSSAYKLLTDDSSLSGDALWKNLWKWDGPRKGAKLSLVGLAERS